MTRWRIVNTELHEADDGPLVMYGEAQHAIAEAYRRGFAAAIIRCRAEADRIADKFLEEVGPAIISAGINEIMPHDRIPDPKEAT